MKIKIVIASQKGGVGKTTISMNMGVAFAEKGFKTLVVDCDPQGAINLSLAKGGMEFPGLMEVLSRQKDPQHVLLKTSLPNLSFLPKGRLAMKDVPNFEGSLFHGYTFREILTSIESKFDLMIIDTPAGLGMITRAAMKAGTHVLVPFKVDSLNLRSINQIFQVIDHVQNGENPDLQYLGMVLTMFEKGQGSALKVAGKVWKDFPMVLDTTIPYAEVFLNASDYGVPISFLGKSPIPEANRFKALTDEILKLLTPEEDSEQKQTIRRLI